MLKLSQIQEQISQFAQERDWEQFHTPKNLSMALSVEASELMEIFQWLKEKESFDIMQTDKATQVRHEVADVAVYLFRICDLLKIDLQTAIEEKLIHNAQKYPVDKSKGSSKKYNEL
jgi:dCTP diphosphatase